MLNCLFVVRLVQWVVPPLYLDFLGFVVGGLFNKKGIQFCKGLVRLESDGQIDLSFDTGAGVGVDPFDYGNTGVSSMQVMDDNSVIIGGNFSSFNGIGKNRLAKINLSSVGLPLTLISFTGQKELNFNQINWTSSFEVYFKGYEVQKSRDGHNFVKIGFVLSKHAKDNEQNYLFSDTQVNEALNYYRLKMVDEDKGDRRQNHKLCQDGTGKRHRHFENAHEVGFARVQRHTKHQKRQRHATTATL